MRSDVSGSWPGKAIVIMPLSVVIVSLLLFNLISLPVSYSSVQCKAGEAACFCKAVGGSWLATPTTIHPTCRKSINYQGKTVNKRNLLFLLAGRHSTAVKVLVPRSDALFAGHQRTVSIYFPKGIQATGKRYDGCKC
jgi:hypothetical protein